MPGVLVWRKDSRVLAVGKMLVRKDGKGGAKLFNDKALRTPKLCFSEAHV